MSELTLGVVIPAYNAQRWLAQALDSVMAQRPAPLDVVVVDDGSSDATARVAERHGAPVRVLRQANAGIGAARNRGLEAVEGELVTFLDSDDLLPPRSVSCRIDVLGGRDDVDIVYGHVRRFVELRDGEPVALPEPAQPSHVPASMLVRRDALERVGPFLEGVRVSEGLDWLLRARELGLVELTVPEHVLWRRVHGENNSLRHRGDINEFARALKASLDRRRAVGSLPPAEPG